MPPPTSSPSDSGYETGGNAEGYDDYDFYAHNRPPSPRTPELFPTPPRHKMQRLAREQQAAADAAAAEQLRQRLLAEQQKQDKKKRDDNDHRSADHPDDPNTSRARARDVTPAQDGSESSQDSSSYDIIPDDEVAAARRKEAEALQRKHDEEYYKRVTDQSISGFGVHAVQEGLKGLKMHTEPLTKRIEESKSKWLKKPVGTPEELQCPCWNYPDGGWRFCPIHEGQHGGDGRDDEDEDEGVVVDEDDIDVDDDDDDIDEDEDEDGGICVGTGHEQKEKRD